MKTEQHKTQQKGLSDSELIEKYGNGKKINFKKILKPMLQTPSNSAILRKGKSSII